MVFSKLSFFIMLLVVATYSIVQVQGCYFDYGVDYKGGDIPGYGQISTYSEYDCQGHCNRNYQCKYFSYRKSDSKCWLKGYGWTAQPNGNIISGKKC